jgi:DNA repair protein RadC
VAARKTSCETFKAGAEFELDVCITARATGARAKLDSTWKAVAFLHDCLNIGGIDREKFWVIALDTGLHPLALVEISSGGVAHAAVDVALTLRRVLQVPGAVAFMTAHNHPSGNVAPSRDDVHLWDLISEAAARVQLRAYDHIILVGDKTTWYSTASGPHGAV